MLPHQRKIILLCLSICSLALACRAAGLPGDATATPSTPVASPSPQATDTPYPTLIVFTPPPLTPSPEPKKYTVRKGDTLSDIAFSLGLKVEEIVAANPGMDAQYISPGQEIIIPTIKGGKVVQAQPTIMPVRIDPPACYPGAEGGLACIAAAHNDGGDPVEGLRVTFTLHAADGSALQSIPAVSPLERLGPGKSLPLSAFFPPPLNDVKGISVAVLNALASRAGGSRFADLFVQVNDTQIEENGSKAVVEGVLTVYDRNLEPGTVSLAATGYDKDGRAQGVRIWQNANPLADGQPAEFTIAVYSLGGILQSVDVQGEARP